MKVVATLALFFLLASAAPEGEARAAQDTRREAGSVTAGRAGDAAGGVVVAGVVLDAAGSPVEGAEVVLRAGASDGGEAAAGVTGPDGRFSFAGVASSDGSVSAAARGFESRAVRWRAAGGSVAEVVIVLAPAPFDERVTVTATRTETRVGETAASVRVLTREDLSTTAAQTLDDALRQTPGFQLFRRTGSRAANPTAQGVSLRGVGASGASRALVLSDGVSLNDPFGGWVQWGRVPRESIARVEVLRGGASSLYGSAALGGVIQVVTRPAAERPALSFSASYGSLRTRDASVFAAGRRGRWDASLAAETFHTGGYYLTARDARGTADARANARYSSLVFTAGREVGDRLRLFARGSYFGEARENGTNLQYNRTLIRQLVAGGDWDRRGFGAVAVRAYASTQGYDQSFSAVSADRDAETLTRLQRVPAQSAGASAQWSGAAGGRHALVAGGDWREVRGASDEVGFAAGRAATATGAGGRERSFGLFVEDAVTLSPRVLLTAGARFDRRRNYGAFAASRSLARPGPAAVEIFPNRTESAFSPRASLLVRLSEQLSAYGAGYGAFRAPTLNELYRGFRVGDVQTLANEGLRAERLAGGEGGVSFRGPRLAARGAFFWSEVTRPIANATLLVTPQLITRQRRNLGRTRSRGLEAEAEARLDGRWTLSGGYQLTDATIAEFPADASLVGARLPQTPRHLFTFAAVYAAAPGWRLALQGRAAGAQFDDDQNLLRLGGFAALDAFAARRLAAGVEAFAAAENVFNRRYEVGRTPNTTLGPPVTVRAGIRVNLGPR